MNFKFDQPRSKFVRRKIKNAFFILPVTNFKLPLSEGKIDEAEDEFEAAISLDDQNEFTPKNCETLSKFYVADKSLKILQQKAKDENEFDDTQKNTSNTPKNSTKFDISESNVITSNSASYQNIINKNAKYKRWKSKNYSSIQNLTKSLTETQTEFNMKTWKTLNSKKERDPELNYERNDKLEISKIVEKVTDFDEIFNNFEKNYYFQKYFPRNNCDLVLLNYNRRINFNKIQRATNLESQTNTHLSKLKKKIEKAKKNSIKRKTESLSQNTNYKI